MTEHVNNDILPPASPYELFGQWLHLAEASEPNDPNAMSLATVGDDGRPSVRMVLMKGYDEKGFTFFTNQESHKANQLAQHPVAALCFHWKSLRRQVRIEGPVMRTSDAESDSYFATRPRGSQIGAWASQQSRALADRQTLQMRIEDVKKQYEGRDVPRPPHWGGYLVTPLLIEFWQDREFRLHDRIMYRREKPGDTWHIERLYP